MLLSHVLLVCLEKEQVVYVVTMGTIPVLVSVTPEP